MLDKVGWAASVGTTHMVPGVRCPSPTHGFFYNSSKTHKISFIYRKKLTISFSFFFFYSFLKRLDALFRSMIAADVMHAFISLSFAMFQASVRINSNNILLSFKTTQCITKSVIFERGRVKNITFFAY